MSIAGISPLDEQIIEDQLLEDPESEEENNSALNNTILNISNSLNDLAVNQLSPVGNTVHTSPSENSQPIINASYENSG